MEQGAEGDFDGEGGESEGLDTKKIILFIVLPLVLLIGAGGGLYFTGMLDSLLGKEEACVEQLDEHGAVIEACPAEEHAAEGAQGGGHGEASGGHGAAGGAWAALRGAHRRQECFQLP